MTAERYIAQVQLLLRAIPEIAREEMFALKGGTAINLFVRNLPRLSVDIDLVYLPVADRTSSLAAVRDGLGRVGDRLEKLGLNVTRQLLKAGKRLVVSEGTSSIKVEVSPVLRGTVFEPKVLAVSEAVQERFGFAEMPVVSMPISTRERSRPRWTGSIRATCSMFTSCLKMAASTRTSSVRSSSIWSVTTGRPSSSWTRTFRTSPPNMTRSSSA